MNSGDTQYKLFQANKESSGHQQKSGLALFIPETELTGLFRLAIRFLFHYLSDWNRTEGM